MTRFEAIAHEQGVTFSGFVRSFSKEWGDWAAFIVNGKPLHVFQGLSDVDVAKAIKAANRG